MASLIPPQLIAALLDQQQQSQQPTQADSRQLASMYNPAMQMQLAHAMRQRQNPNQMGNAPLADHVRQAKAAGTVGTPAATAQPMAPPQPQAQANPQAGTMTVMSGGHNPMSDASMAQWAARAQHDASFQPGASAAPIIEQTGNGAMPMSPDARQQIAATVAAQPGMQAQLGSGATGASRTAGFNVSGMGAPQQQQAVDPVANLMNAFKGHVPDHILAGAQQAIAAGIPLKDVYNHLNSFVTGDARADKSEGFREKAQGEREARAADRANEGNSRMLSEMRIRHLEAEQKTAYENGGPDAGAVYEKQIQDEMNKMAGTQPGTQIAGGGQVPQPPKPGTKLTPDAIAAISKVAKTRQEAEQMAQQAGWSL